MFDLLEKAKPILFNTEMVKAILDGRKIHTRRVIPYGEYLYEPMNELCIEVAKNYCDMDKENHPELKKEMIKHSRIRVDDILYVRETFQYGDNIRNKQDIPLSDDIEILYYENEINHANINQSNFAELIKWKPSIHMPKKFARIFLKVTNVRVERLQDISLNDISKEGSPMDVIRAEEIGEPDFCFEWWIDLWNSTSKQGYKWEDNPYVFVYEFERIES
jgi:hypothetical protein